MPEIREYCATGHILDWGLAAARKDGANLTLQAIVGDDTDEEAQKSAALRLAKRWANRGFDAPEVEVLS